MEITAFRRMMYLIGFSEYYFDVPTFITQTEFPDLESKNERSFLRRIPFIFVAKYILLKDALKAGAIRSSDWLLYINNIPETIGVAECLGDQSRYRFSGINIVSTEQIAFAFHNSLRFFNVVSTEYKDTINLSSFSFPGSDLVCMARKKALKLISDKSSVHFCIRQMNFYTFDSFISVSYLLDDIIQNVIDTSGKLWVHKNLRKRTFSVFSEISDISDISDIGLEEDTFEKLLCHETISKSSNSTMSETEQNQGINETIIDLPGDIKESLELFNVGRGLNASNSFEGLKLTFKILKTVMRIPKKTKDIESLKEVIKQVREENGTIFKVFDMYAETFNDFEAYCSDVFLKLYGTPNGSQIVWVEDLPLLKTIYELLKYKKVSSKIKLRQINGSVDLIRLTRRRFNERYVVSMFNILSSTSSDDTMPRIEVVETQDVVETQEVVETQTNEDIHSRSSTLLLHEYSKSKQYIVKTKPIQFCNKTWLLVLALGAYLSLTEFMILQQRQSFAILATAVSLTTFGYILLGWSVPSGLDYFIFFICIPFSACLIDLSGPALVVATILMLLFQYVRAIHNLLLILVIFISTAYFSWYGFVVRLLMILITTHNKRINESQNCVSIALAFWRDSLVLVLVIIKIILCRI